MSYSQRYKTYINALIRHGERSQLVVALEELSECQKEICKMLRDLGSEDHLAEEVADAIIMLERVQMIFGIGDKVRQEMDRKVARLDKSLESTAEHCKGGTSGSGQFG